MTATRSRRSMISPGSGQPELDAFARFCSSVLTAEDGRPFQLGAFQKTILADYFQGCRETCAILPKKNGKSSLVGASSLWHLLAVPFAEALIVAAARDQAGIILRQVTGFIKRSPLLRERLKIVLREVRNEELDGRLRVLASDVDTVDGQLPTLVAVDELARHRSIELYGILRDGCGPRDGQMIAISAAGDREDSPLGVLRASAYELPGLVREGAHRYVSTGSFAFHEWALDAGQDVDDLELVKTANPLVSVDDLRERKQSPTMTDWAWRRFACGIWAMGEHGAVQPHEWHALATVPLDVPEPAQGPYIGVDLGWKWDTTAIVPVWIQGGGWVDGRPVTGRNEWVLSKEPATAYVEAPVVLTPPRDGTSLAVDDVFAACEQMAERWPGCVFVLDPAAGGEQLAQRLDVELDGCRVATYSQANTPMCRASARLAEAVTGGRLHHPADPTLTAHVLNAGVRQVAASWRLAKQPGSRGPIDAAVALAMALSAGLDDIGDGTDAPAVPPGGYVVRGFN